jgi:uncharacterized protein
LKILIADTSPLISLMVIRKLDILFMLYPDVIIPGSVWTELEGNISFLEYGNEADMLRPCVQAVNNRLVFPEIDEGEADAISLYIEMGADVLLIDDKKGRQIAERNQVNCIGSLALLVAAKENGLIPALRPVFLSLISNNRFYQKELLNRILELKNEDPIG